MAPRRPHQSPSWTPRLGPPARPHRCPLCLTMSSVVQRYSETTSDNNDRVSRPVSPAGVALTTEAVLTDIADLREGRSVSGFSCRRVVDFEVGAWGQRFDPILPFPGLEGDRLNTLAVGLGETMFSLFGGGRRFVSIAPINVSDPQQRLCYLALTLIRGWWRSRSSRGKLRY